MARNSKKVLQQELINFNSFQDNQLNVLESISSSITNTSESMIEVRDSLTSLTQVMSSMNDSYQQELSNRRKANEEMAKHTKSIWETNKALSFLRTHISDLAKDFANIANNYSKMSNSMLQLTGTSGADVRQFRSDLVHDVVAQLNKETGNAFNPEKSYQRILDVATQANVGSLEAIQEMSRSILLADSAMNINTGELASTLNRLYKRYNFSSTQMEKMVDDIRGNTANNNATSEEIMQNINKFSNAVGYYSPENIEAMNQIISARTAELSDAGINSGYVSDQLYKILTGELPDTAITKILAEAGLDYTELQASMRSGNAEEFDRGWEAFNNAIISIGEDFKTNVFSAEGYRRLGFDPELMFDYGSGARALAEGPEISASDAPSTVDVVRDQFFTWKEQWDTKISTISEYLAGIQENLGIGFSDILIALSSLSLASSLKNLASNGGLGRLGGGASTGGALASMRGLVGSHSGAAGATTSGLLGALEMGGFNASAGALTGTAATAVGAATLGGAALGAGGLVYGVSSGIRDISEGSTGTGVANIAGGVATGVGAGALTASLLGAGAANFWNPIGWAALIGGGATLIGTALYKGATRVEGNVEQVLNDVENIGRSLEKENQTRLDKISDLNYQFNQLTDITEQRALLENSGLISQEELSATADENLKALIESYKNAAIAMNDATDSILKKTEESYKEEQKNQQNDFISDLKSIEDDSGRINALKTLSTEITDEKLLKKISKAIKDDKVSDSEWNDILTGGKNAWLDSHNLKNQAVGVTGMRLVAGQQNWDRTYYSTDNMYDVARLFSDYYNAPNESEAKSAWAKIEKAGLTSEVMKHYGDDITNLMNVRGYRTGSNYISSDQLAKLHEGESVVPKQYNPAANVTELEMLRKYYQENSSKENSQMNNYLKEFTTTLQDIKIFLEKWKEDNAIKDATMSRATRYAAQSSYYGSFLKA